MTETTMATAAEARQPLKRFCPKCGKSLLERGSFCPGCGKEAGEDDAFCGGCGTKLADPEPGVFCPHCGESWSTASSQQHQSGTASATSLGADAATGVASAVEKAHSVVAQATQQAGKAFRGSAASGVATNGRAAAIDLPFASALAGCAVAVIALLVPWVSIDWNSGAQLGFAIFGFNAPDALSIWDLSSLAMALTGESSSSDLSGIATLSYIMTAMMVISILMMLVGLAYNYMDRKKCGFIWVAALVLVILMFFWLAACGTPALDKLAVAVSVTPAPFVAILAAAAAAFLPGWLAKQGK